MDLVFDGKCLTVKDGADISLATISEMRIVSDTECSYKIGEDTVTLTVEWDSNGDMINIKKKHSLNEEEQEKKKEELEEGTIILARLGKSVVLDGGRLKAEICPDKMENLSEGNKIEAVLYYDTDTVTVTGTIDTDESGKEIIKDFKMEIDGYEPKQPSEENETEIDEEKLPIIISAFRNFIVCESGDLSDNVLPDRIHVVSDHEYQFTYGEDVEVLSFERDGDKIIKNIKHTKLQDEG